MGRSDVRLGRIAAGFAQRAPLAQQVPALIQLRLQVRQALAFAVGKRLLFKEAVLFGSKALDMGQNRCVFSLVFHARLRSRGIRYLRAELSAFKSTSSNSVPLCTSFLPSGSSR